MLRKMGKECPACKAVRFFEERKEKKRVKKEEIQKEEAKVAKANG